MKELDNFFDRVVYSVAVPVACVAAAVWMLYDRQPPVPAPPPLCDKGTQTDWHDCLVDCEIQTEPRGSPFDEGDLVVVPSPTHWYSF